MTGIYKPENVIHFGKNRGYVLSTIWKYEPTYIAWLIVNHETFCIDEEKFRLLPTPTPFSIGAVSNSEKYKEIMNSTSNLLIKLTKTDSNNYRLCVNDIIALEHKGYILSEQAFWFDEDIIRLNTAKKRIFEN